MYMVVKKLLIFRVKITSSGITRYKLAYTTAACSRAEGNPQSLDHCVTGSWSAHYDGNDARRRRSYITRDATARLT